MFPSYNHNIAYAGHTFHVQTEISTTAAHALVTHLFLAGDIIATLRSAVDTAGDPAVLTAAMQKQHQDAMRALIAGSHDAALAARGISLTRAPKF